MDRSGERLPERPGAALGRRDFLRGIAATGAAAGAGGLTGRLRAAAPLTRPARPPGAPRRGGNLKVGLSGGSSSDTLDPHQGLTYLDTGRFEALYQPLVKLGSRRRSSSCWQSRLPGTRVVCRMDHPAPAWRYLPQREGPDGR